MKQQQQQKNSQKDGLTVTERKKGLYKIEKGIEWY